MRWFALVAAMAVLWGCNGDEMDATGDVESPEQVGGAENPDFSQNQGGQGVGFVGSGAGGLAPVTGTENLQGGSGGGVGQAAREQAQRVGGTAPSSLDGFSSDY